MNPYHKPVIEQYEAFRGGKIIPYYRFRIPQNGYQTARFGHRSRTVLTKDNFIISDTHTSGEFTVEKTERKGVFETRFQTSASAADSSNPGITDFLNLARLFMLPTKDLRFRLDKNGRIGSVLNSESVFTLWEEVYHFLAAEMTNRELLKSIKQKGDNEFSHVFENIRKVGLYSLFFFPVFDKDFKFEEKYRSPFILASQFLPGETLWVDLQQTKIRAEEDHIHFLYEGETSDAELLKKTEKIYGQLINEKHEHRLKIELSYHLDAATGYPVSIDLFAKEILGNFFCSEQTIGIYILEEPAHRAGAVSDSSPAATAQKPDEPEEEPTAFHSWILDDEDSFV